MTQKQISLIPYVCGAGASVTGPEQGPSFLKERGLVEDLSGPGRIATWQEDPARIYEQERGLYASLPPRGSKERKDIVLRHCRHISDEVEKAVRKGVLPVTVGGDHSMSAGSVAGLARGAQAHGHIGLIWVDAHPDLQINETSPSLAIHGMPVAALLGLGDPDFATIGGMKPVLKPKHIIYVGLRSIDPDEKLRIREMGIKSFTIEDLVAPGGRERLLRAVNVLAKKMKKMVYSLDIDAIDPAVAPATGSPVEKGFGREELLSLLPQMIAQGPPDVVELVEFNPSLPGADATYAIARDVLDAILS
ncbi:MAG: arginase [Alphaproteobacteria bacterium]|nr:arginase [Alphaproteobacteria bacterium]